MEESRDKQKEELWSLNIENIGYYSLGIIYLKFGFIYIYFNPKK
jgi:hypothetical protein